jgi:hypothetical protein
LQIVFHMMHHARRTAGCGGHMEPVFGQAANDTVIIDETILTQHDAVLAATRGQLVPAVGVHQI